MKKKLLSAVMLTVAAIALVVASVLATIAYMTSSTAVSNTFTVGNVGITMFESKVNPEGQRVHADGTPLASGDPIVKDVDGNSYHLIPGRSYIKDPTIYVDAASDNCYLFIKTRNQIAHLEDGNVPDSGNNNPTMRKQLEDHGWVRIYTFNDGESIYCYKGTGTIESGSNKIATPVEVDKLTTQRPDRGIDLFDTFTIDPQADVTKSGSATVTITAFAIQYDGFQLNYPAGSASFMMSLWNIINGEYESVSSPIPQEAVEAGVLPGAAITN